MPYSSIDLQMAIPRAPETSSTQSHSLQKPAMNQMSLATETTKHTEQLRSKNSGIEKNNKTGIQNHQRPKSDSRQHRTRKGKNHIEHSGEETEPIQEHPYKGKHIDISL